MQSIAPLHPFHTVISPNLMKRLLRYSYDRVTNKTKQHVIKNVLPIRARAEVGLSYTNGYNLKTKGIKAIASPMSQTLSLQAVIESVEALSDEEQDLLFQLVQQRRIAKRRQEIAQNATQTLAAVAAGTAKSGSVADLMRDVLGEDT